MARVAFIVDELFEDAELRVPYDGLRREGHDVIVLGREAKKPLKGKRGRQTATPDLALRDVSADEFDALVIPGGYSPDKLRTDHDAVRFTREMFDSGKIVAAVCHAGSLLIEAGVVGERTLTSWPSIMTDLVNAGAHWVDREVVEDGNLITSRKPDDLPAFTAAILRQLERRQPEMLRSPPTLEPGTPAASANSTGVRRKPTAGTG